MFFTIRPKSSLAKILLILALTTSLPALAGNEGSGGGNAVVARLFVYQAYALSQEFKALPKALVPDWFSPAIFEAAVGHVKAYGVDELEPEPGSQGMYLNARFYPQEKVIRVRWKDLEKLSRDEVRSLAMHEYLGVLYMEKDGRYDRSSQMLAILAGMVPPPSSGGTIDWMDPPIICGENQDFGPEQIAGWTSYWRNAKLKADATSEDRLRYAMLTGDAQTVKPLLAAGLNPNTPIEACEMQVDGSTQEITVKRGCGILALPLKLAIESGGRSEVVQVLLEAGANPNPPGKLEKSPLARALGRARSEVATIRALVQHGARYRDEKEQFAFEMLLWLNPGEDGEEELICPMMSKIKFFQMLGFDLNDPRWPSAVQLAFNVNVPMLKLFKKLGARFDLAVPGFPAPYDFETYRGMTPLHALAIVDRSSRYQYNKAQTARYLVLSGANPAAKDASGMTALDRSWKYFTENHCGSDSKVLNHHCMAERALIEYLVEVTPKN